MHWQLTLTWTESNRVKTQMISGLPIGEISKAFRIGRDPKQCDLVLADNTVSRLHIEIFFKVSWNRFYVKNMQPKNPPKIDGGFLIEGEVALNRGSILELGRTKLAITDISEAQPYSQTAAIVSSTSPPTLATPLASNPPIGLSIYRLECPHCRTILPLDMRESACTHCGHFLADAESILISPSR